MRYKIGILLFCITIGIINASNNSLEFIRDLAKKDVKEKYPEVDLETFNGQIKYVGKTYVKREKRNYAFSIVPIILLQLIKEDQVISVPKPQDDDLNKEERRKAYCIAEYIMASSLLKTNYKSVDNPWDMLPSSCGGLWSEYEWDTIVKSRLELRFWMHSYLQFTNNSSEAIKLLCPRN